VTGQLTGPRGESGLDFRLLDGPEALGYEPDLAALHGEIYADPPYQEPINNGQFRARFGVQRRQPGFVLAAAWHGGYLVGYATGMPLRPSTSWWRDLTTTVPDDVTAEHPGRTFALTELAVRSAWRRQGTGRALYDLVLAGREEERLTLAVLPAATAAQQAFRQWGWHKVARSRDPRPGPPAPGALVYDILIRNRRSG
jgi:ribosomal protein S18 acetylase RimI-like enzyme